MQLDTKVIFKKVVVKCGDSMITIPSKDGDYFVVKSHDEYYSINIYDSNNKSKSFITFDDLSQIEDEYETFIIKDLKVRGVNIK